MRLRRYLFAFLTILALYSALASLASEARRSAGVAPLPRGARLVGLAPSSLPMGTMTLVMRPPARERVSRLLAELNDPESPEYRHWITPAEFADRLGPRATDYAKVVGWLENKGFEIVHTWPGRLTVDFRGTAGQVSAAFGTEIALHRLGARVYHAPSRAPEIPAELAGTVLGVVGLDNFPRIRPLAGAGRLEPLVKGANGNVLGPVDLQVAYNAQPVYAMGITGSGQRIAVVAVSDFGVADVDSFRRKYRLPPLDLKKTVVGSNPGGCDASDPDLQQCAAEIEAVLDAEWAGALAPEARIEVIIGGGTEIATGLLQALSYAATESDASVLSVSFGACEGINRSVVASLLEALYALAVARGMSVLVSAGDSGVADCVLSDPHNAEPSVNLLASPPEVTAVGGTILDPLFDAVGNATGYGGETVWNDPAAGDPDGGAGGGGASTFFAKPSYQFGPGVPEDGRRDIPDVAMTASPSFPGHVVIWRGRAWRVGGTSVSAPAWAGVVALLAQAHGGRLGLLNGELYRLGRMQFFGTPRPFHDITDGDNSFGGTPGFAAGPGYDLATGWGSPDVEALLGSFGAFPGGCESESECDDANPCTADACLGGAGCSNITLPDGSPCPPPDVCAAGAVCTQGVCEPTGERDCDDGNPCTDDACEPHVGCVHTLRAGCAGQKGRGRCMARWLVMGPEEVLLTRRARCHDGDPTCDRDPAPGVCGFEVALCANLSVGRGKCASPARMSFNVHRPSRRAAAHSPQASSNRQRLEQALGGLGAQAVLPRDRCSDPVTAKVRLRRDGKRAGRVKLVVRVKRLGKHRRRARAALRLRCLPGTPGT